MPIAERTVTHLVERYEELVAMCLAVMCLGSGDLSLSRCCAAKSSPPPKEQEKPVAAPV